MADQVISLEYCFNSRDEAAVASALSALEADLGGQRRPWGAGGGAIDLVTFLEITITFVAGATFGEAMKRYFAGLGGAEKAEELGERHRVAILEWHETLKENLHRLVSSVRRRFREGLRATRSDGTEQAIAIRIELAQLQFYIVLNGRNVSDDALENLPRDLSRMLQFIAEDELPEEATFLQLCSDSGSDEWRYLLVPSNHAFGRYVDRAIDLSTRQLLILRSREEFIDLLGATEADGLKFLVSPYRYTDSE